MQTLSYHPATIPPMPAVARILSRYDRESLAVFLTVAIDLMDAMDDDPDLEPCGDDEAPFADGDTGDVSWAEIPALRGRLIAGRNEDDELAGDETDGNAAEDDECAWFAIAGCGAGCEVSDAGGSGEER